MVKPVLWEKEDWKEDENVEEVTALLTAATLTDSTGAIITIAILIPVDNSLASKVVVVFSPATAPAKDDNVELN